MSELQRILGNYVKGVQFSEVSGFEVLELLDIRSRLAARESELDAAQRTQLEDTDVVFLHHASKFYEAIATLGNLKELRRRAAASCSHWWWHLEKLRQREPVET